MDRIAYLAECLIIANRMAEGEDKQRLLKLLAFLIADICR